MIEPTNEMIEAGFTAASGWVDRNLVRIILVAALAAAEPDRPTVWPRELTDDLVQLAVGQFLAAPTSNIREIDAAMRGVLTSVLAVAERNQAARAEAEAVAERERIRQVLSAPFLAAVRAVPDGEIRQGCVVQDGESVRYRAKQAYRTAFPSDQAGRP